jgi:heme/copper-type cytochrome/quinol oxidase subunit 4
MKATRVLAFVASVVITLAAMLVVTDDRFVARVTPLNDIAGAHVAASVHWPRF